MPQPGRRRPQWQGLELAAVGSRGSEARSQASRTAQLARVEFVTAALCSTSSSSSSCQFGAELTD
jgi:hypothetical protein